MEIEINRHDEPRTVLEMLLDAGDGEPFEMVLEGGRIVDPAEMLPGIKAYGIYGFFDADNNTIEYWSDPKSDIVKIVDFFGHELGHASESKIREALEDDTGEDLAEVCAEISATAFAFACSVKAGDD